MIKYVCPHCGAPVVAASADAGRAHECPKCGASSPVPHEGSGDTLPTGPVGGAAPSMSHAAPPVREQVVVVEDDGPGCLSGCLAGLALEGCLSGCIGCLAPVLLVVSALIWLLV